MKKETFQTILIILACIAMCFAGCVQAQKIKPRLDTVQNKVIFTDETGVKYEVRRSEKNNRSYITKKDEKGKEFIVFLFRKKED